MTEKQGGSDVRANTTRAEPLGRRRRAERSPGTSGSARHRCATCSSCSRRHRRGAHLLRRAAGAARRLAQHVPHPAAQGQARQPVERVGRDRARRDLGAPARRRGPRRRDDHRDGVDDPPRLRARLRGPDARGRRAGHPPRARTGRRSARCSPTSRSCGRCWPTSRSSRRRRRCSAMRLAAAFDDAGEGELRRALPPARVAVASTGSASGHRRWSARRWSAWAATGTSRRAGCRGSTARRRSTRSGRARATSTRSTCCARWPASRRASRPSSPRSRWRPARIRASTRPSTAAARESRRMYSFVMRSVRLSGAMAERWPPFAPTIWPRIPIGALMERNPGVDWQRSTTSIFGCANQAGEDNRNVARMALLLAGLPRRSPGTTVNRLCGSSMDAVGARGARDQVRRDRADDRRRRGEHVARAVRHGKGRHARSAAMPRSSTPRSAGAL